MNTLAIVLIIALVCMATAFQAGLKTRVNVNSKLQMALADYKDELAQTAASIASPGKGILAVDESTKTIGKRLQGIGIENTEENRQAYRGLLFSTEGLGKYISGAILYEETLFQSSVDGTPFVKILKDNGIFPGIKVDTGLQPLPGGSEIETWCTGLDGLQERAAAYYKQGARFAKWRAVLQITADGCPTDTALKENAWGLARYARACQESGLVPIVEPEILMDGDHNIETTAKVQERVLSTVYKALQDNGVFLEGSLLKPSMTVPGAECTDPVTKEKIAEYTIRTLERTVRPGSENSPHTWSRTVCQRSLPSLCTRRALSSSPSLLVECCADWCLYHRTRASRVGTSWTSAWGCLKWRAALIAVPRSISVNKWTISNGWPS